VRLFTRNGHDWTERFRRIVAAALRNRRRSFVHDGEAVLLGVAGVSDFNGLHSRRHDDEVEFYAFDCLVGDGDDLRRLPLSMRKTNLARLLARRVDGTCRESESSGRLRSTSHGSRHNPSKRSAAATRQTISEAPVLHDLAKK